MSTFRLTKDGTGLMKYSKDSSIAQKETQYSDRASKQLAEDVFAKNRADHDHDTTRSKAPKSKTDRELERKTRPKSNKPPADGAALPLPAPQLTPISRSSIANPPTQPPSIHAPLIQSYYDSGTSSLRDYIKRSYLPWKQILGVNREAMEAKLGALLDQVKKQGTIEYLEWGALPLPQEVVWRERAGGKEGWGFKDVVGWVGQEVKER
jgi:hypothetical protein